MADWRLESYDRNRNFLGVLPHSNIQGEFYGSKHDQMRFNVPLRHDMVSSTTLSSGVNEIWAFRNDELVYSGVLWDMDIDGTAGRIGCTTEGLETYFEGRRIQNDVEYNQSGSECVWDMIQKSQALPGGDLGITRGQIDPSPGIAIKYWANEGKMIDEAIEDLAKEGEFDFSITADRKVNISYPRSQVPSRSRLMFPGNIKTYNIAVTGKIVANDILMRGNGAFVTPVIDTNSRSIYGLRQATVTNQALKSVTQLANAADEEIKFRRQARWVPTVSVDATVVNPFEGDISHGELIHVEIADGWVNLDTTLRCIGWQVTVNQSGGESVNLYLNDMRELEEVV